MSKTVPITSSLGNGPEDTRLRMRSPSDEGETMISSPSEDLWVQVESSDAEAPHIEVDTSGRGNSEG